MRINFFPPSALIGIGMYTLCQVTFGEDLNLLILGASEVMIGGLALIHSDV